MLKWWVGLIVLATLLGAMPGSYAHQYTVFGEGVNDTVQLDVRATVTVRGTEAFEIDFMAAESFDRLRFKVDELPISETGDSWFANTAFRFSETHLELLNPSKSTFKFGTSHTNETRFTMGSWDSLRLYDYAMEVRLATIDGSLAFGFEGGNQSGQAVYFSKQYLHDLGIQKPNFVHESGQTLPILVQDEGYIISPPHFSFILVKDSGSDSQNTDYELRLIDEASLFAQLDQGHVSMTLLDEEYEFSAVRNDFTIHWRDYSGYDGTGNLSIRSYDLSSHDGRDIVGFVREGPDGPVIGIGHNETSSNRVVLVAPTGAPAMAIGPTAYTEVSVATHINASVPGPGANDSIPLAGPTVDPPLSFVGSPMKYSTLLDDAATSWIRDKYGDDHINEVCHRVVMRFPFFPYGFQRAKVPVTQLNCFAISGSLQDYSQANSYRRDDIRLHLEGVRGWVHTHDWTFVGDFWVGLTGEVTRESRGAAWQGPYIDTNDQLRLPEDTPSRYAAVSIAPDMYPEEDPYNVGNTLYEHSVSIIWQHEAGHILGADHHMSESVTCEFRGSAMHYPVSGSTIMDGSTAGQSIASQYCPQFSAPSWNEPFSMAHVGKYSEPSIQLASFLYTQEPTKYW